MRKHQRDLQNYLFLQNHYVCNIYIYIYSHFGRKPDEVNVNGSTIAQGMTARGNSKIHKYNVSHTIFRLFISSSIVRFRGSINDVRPLWRHPRILPRVCKTSSDELKFKLIQHWQ